MMLNNGKYKILVDNLDDFREASYILRKLNHTASRLVVRGYEGEDFHQFEGDLLNLNQLKDIAVLQRNDVNDVNYKNPTDDYYLSSDCQLYVWNKGKWEKTFVKLELNNESSAQEQLEDKLKEIQEKEIQEKEIQESGLISGAEALRTLADGEDVDVHESTYKKEVWFDLRKTRFTPSEILEGKVRDKPYTLTFRLKPRTVKLEIEVPAPFEPKENEKFWIISGEFELGYTSSYSNKLRCLKWRTEAEIKIVVDQIRKLKELGK